MSEAQRPASSARRVALALLRALYAALVVGGWTCALGALAVWVGMATAGPGVPMAVWVLGGVGVVIAILVAIGAAREQGLPEIAVARDLLVLGALPAWGMVYSHLADTSCETRCGGETFRPLAEPELWAFLGLHLGVVLAYAVARRRPSLPPLTEVVVQGALLTGLLMQVLLGVHFGRFVLMGLALAPLLMPAFSPVLAVVLYGLALWPRLRAADAPWRGLLASGGILGVYSALHALWLGQPAGALQVFTRTCSWTLSTLPVTALPDDCHYLCTVAARGHPSLVRPIRLGRRRGVTIVVNRQLAIANAFEDLLHQRWPQLGRAARRGYDRLARPICDHLRPRWVSDVVYLVMKPAEWAFYLVLLLLDPQDPERRIDAMYR